MLIRAYQAPLTRGLGLFLLMDAAAWIAISIENVVPAIASGEPLPFTLVTSLFWGPGVFLIIALGAVLLLTASGRIESYFGGPLPCTRESLPEILEAQQSLLEGIVPLVGLTSIGLAVDPLVVGLNGLFQEGSAATLAPFGCRLAEGLIRAGLGVWLVRSRSRIAHRLSRRPADHPVFQPDETDEARC